MRIKKKRVKITNGLFDTFSKVNDDKYYVPTSNIAKEIPINKNIAYVEPYGSKNSILIKDEDGRILFDNITDIKFNIFYNYMYIYNNIHMLSVINNMIDLYTYVKDLKNKLLEIKAEKEAILTSLLEEQNNESSS